MHNDTSQGGSISISGVLSSVSSVLMDLILSNRKFTDTTLDLGDFPQLKLLRSDFRCLTYFKPRAMWWRRGGGGVSKSSLESWVRGKVQLGLSVIIEDTEYNNTKYTLTTTIEQWRTEDWSFVVCYLTWLKFSTSWLDLLTASLIESWFGMDEVWVYWILILFSE